MAQRRFRIELEPGHTLDDLVITSVSRDAERLSETATAVDLVSAERIALQQAGSTADLLSEAGSVFVQKSQGGGGSPVIRASKPTRS